MKKPPCDKGCPDRHPGCHDNCPHGFKEWKEECEREKAWLREQNHQPDNEKVRRAGWKNMRWGNRKYKPKK